MGLNVFLDLKYSNKGTVNKMVSFLTVFLSGESVHLYKDVGMVPYALAKYCGYRSALLYTFTKQEMRDEKYEKHVELMGLNVPANRMIKNWYILSYIYKHAKKYDVINFYGAGLRTFIMTILFKMFNPRCKIYIKLDLDERGFYCILNKNWKMKLKNFLLRQFVDLVSVETKAFYDELKKFKYFKNKLIYLPNGMLVEESENNHWIEKENIILTVGRIGAKEKNNELLVRAIEEIKMERLRKWQVYFVGPSTDKFRGYIAQTIEKKPWLRNVFVLTGNIEEKNKLYSIYAKAKVFCLTSYSESFGLVTTEAMYFKNYVISTEFPAVYDILDNQRVGKIIQNNNVDELRCAIEECLEKKINIEKYGEIASVHVKENFNWEVIAERLADKISRIDEPEQK